MTIIRRIPGLRLPGVFRDFRWPGDLLDFGRYNLIYGWNGTGKTSVSRVLRALELRQPLQAGEVVIRIGEKDVRGEDFASVPTPIRVFNKDFVNEAVFPSGGGDVPPIFVVGKESAEKQKEIDDLKRKRREAAASLNSVRSKGQDAERALDNFSIHHAKEIKERLRSSGASNPYNNYDKADFRKRAEYMVSDGDAETHQLSDAERDELQAQHHAKPKERLPQSTYRLLPLQQTADDVSALLSVTVVSKAIQTLKDDPAFAEWTRQGLHLHQERNTDRCLFCDQPLPSGRLDAIEAHFSAEYESFIKKLETKVIELQAAVKQAQPAELALPNKAQFYDDLATQYEEAEQSLRRVVYAACHFLQVLVEKLESKKGRPFDRLDLDVAVPFLDKDVLDRLNAVVRKHNEACDDFQSRVTTARDRLALHIIASDISEFAGLRDAVNQADADAITAEEEVGHLDDEIARLEKGIIEHLQPAEELNEDLRKYLGHEELRLKVNETGYTITRSGIPARTLSEGETTAIALLYFLKSLRDRRFDLKNGVVVLDDPVSSLDANALYLAFGFIRERTEDAGQLFIFTHNFTFFRQVRNWFRHVKGQKKTDVSQRPARFYMLECAAGNGQRCSVIVRLDPLLEQYESEYHYLFSRIYREAYAPSTAGLETNYMLPNIARRVLEGFLAFRQPHISGDLWRKLKDIPFDEARKYRILRFVHTYSHGDTIGEPEHDPSVLGEARSVLRDLLDFVNAQDAEHFAAMRGLVNPSQEDDG